MQTNVSRRLSLRSKDELVTLACDGSAGEQSPAATMSSREELESMAEQAAINAGLNPALVKAICEQESSWKETATRFEPGFKKRYVDPMKLDEAEAIARSTSWGLMQIMGEVAREYGYKGDLKELLKAENSLFWGLKHLKKIFVGKGGDLRATLLRWNGGGRPAYADEVLARMAKYGNI
jgi:soluble lytic murein transglycosylase-like protein